MARRLTNLALLVLLAVAFGTGVAAYALGTGWATWVVVAHGVAGLAIVLLVPWKTPIARSGLRRHQTAGWPSVALAVLVAATVLVGVLHSTGLWHDTGMLAPLNVHVWLAVAAVPLALWHVVARPVRARRTDLNRRTILRGAGVVGGAAATWAALDGIARVTGLAGGDRRFTGSIEVASFDPAGMPRTIWLDDSRPDIDLDEYRLEVDAGGERRTLDLEELAAHEDTMRATLDCTGGWFSTQDWEGVRLDRLLGEAPRGRSVVVRSLTGFDRRLPLGDASSVLLATRVGDRSLSPGHGGPLRLVAPGRRGFWWVKWVSRVTVSDRPWWLQSPFPLS